MVVFQLCSTVLKLPCGNAIGVMVGFDRKTILEPSMLPTDLGLEVLRTRGRVTVTMYRVVAI